MIKLLLVDDHEVVRTGLRNILDNKHGIQIIGEASSGEQAVVLAKTLVPDVIVIDILMPGIGGLEAIRRILRYNPDIKILALTGHQDDVCLSKIIEEGALGYLTKDCDSEEMIRAIKTVYTGQRHMGFYIAKSRLQKFWY